MAGSALTIIIQFDGVLIFFSFVFQVIWLSTAVFVPVCGALGSKCLEIRDEDENKLVIEFGAFQSPIVVYVV